ncbi:MAG: sigma-54 dependent transcriptional regulator [Candidatus Krumholzibacteria bacterium]|nr:sigma-54 dependent transcriptional regulator [Candidatus Krumholzibacteria bacterium]
MTRVLVVDDERNLRRMLRALLEAEGYEVDEAENGEDGRARAAAVAPDVVLLDLVMPPGPDGLAVLERVRADHPDCAVIMMSGKATLADAVRATKLGAFQFLEKPLSAEAVVTTVRAAATLARTRADNRALRAQLPEEWEILGDSPPMRELATLIARVGPTSSRVLIVGESGTGKELVARAIHAASPRAARPMVSVNCAAIPRELVESELFGHEKGAFTGATQRQQGRFELAHGSTLFLDEIGELPLDAQAKLLRVLEEGSVRRVGADRPRPVDVRVLAATNRDLEEDVRTGRFRDDLFFRLHVLPIRVPPLRERLDDLPVLVRHFVRVAAARGARRPRDVTDDALRRLRVHPWPGNVRELANAIERLTIVGGDGPVTREEVDAVLGSPRPEVSGRGGASEARGLAAALAEYERTLIERALRDAGGSVAEAARRLDTDRANLYRRMRRLGLRRTDTDA